MSIKERKSLQGVKEIAKLANVSIGTVDRVLHNRPGVAKKTKEKVLAILEEYHYSPNLIGRSLSKKKSTLIIALIPHSSNESAYWDAPLQGIQQAQEELAKYQVNLEILLYDQDDRHSFLKQIEKIKNMQLDGLVLAPTFLKESIAICEYCDENKIQYSFINSDLKDCNNVAYYGPDLFQSGYLAGSLIKMLSKPGDQLLIVHVSKEMEEDHHVLRKEEGLRTYLEEHDLGKKISRLFIQGTDFNLIARKLDSAFEELKPQVVFVSNSRVSSVARFLQDRQIQDVRLIGFDFMPDNLKYLKEEVIDFLICHKPIEQGFMAVKSLFNKIVLNQSTQKINFMPLDIICKENYFYYEN